MNDGPSPLLTSLLQAMTGEARKPGSEMAAHMPMLHLLARHWSFGAVVECGVGRGYSTIALLSGIWAAGKKLVSYDVSDKVRDMAKKNSGCPDHPAWKDNWEFRQKRAEDGATDWDDGHVSLFFLDTLHTLKDTRAELRAWHPKMHPQGIMCGHDYYLEGYPWPRPGDWLVCGVKQAVHEFADEHRTRYDLHILPHDQGLWILWPRLI
jgi:predicted O-methyltransferase YrrM